MGGKLILFARLFYASILAILQERFFVEIYRERFNK